MARTSGRRVARGKLGRAWPRNVDGEVLRSRARYSEALIAEICELLGEGVKWTHLGGAPGMPSLATLYSWRKTKPGFEARIAVAVAAGATRKAERALEVAESATKETVSVDRLRVDTLMKHAAQMSPYEWGRKAGEPDKRLQSGKREIVVWVRDFRPVTREDGSVFTREVMPDGSTRDFDR